MIFGLFSLLSNTITTQSSDISNTNGVIENIGTVSNFLQHYGPTTVVLSLFLLLFIILILSVLKYYDKLLKKVLSLDNTKSQTTDNDEQLIQTKNSIDSLEEKDKKKLKNILLNLEEENKKHNSPEYNKDEYNYNKKLIDTYIDINMIFTDAVRKAQIKINADRVGIYVFHNGNKSVHGLPFFKMSCVTEWDKEGTLSMRTKYIRRLAHSEMPLHLFFDVIVKLNEEDYYVVKNIEEVKKTSLGLQTFTAYSNIESLILLSIKDNNDNCAGFIVAEFHRIMDGNEINNLVSTMIDAALSIKPLIINFKTEILMISKSNELMEELKDNTL